MKYVQRIVKPNGAVHLYLRRKGLPSMRLASPWPEPGQEKDSPLEREVAALIERLQSPAPTPGTMRQALRDYELKDADFKGLRESTKYEYRLILKAFDKELGDLPVTAFTPRNVLRLRDKWAERGHRRANLRRQVLKNVLKRVIIEGKLDRDPFALVGQVRRPDTLAEPHILWPIEVVETVIKAAIEAKRYGLARAVAIARYTGARRGDLVIMTKAMRKDGQFSWRSGKRRIPVDLKEDPQLTHWLAAIPATHPDTPRRGRKGARNVKRLPATSLVFNLANARYTEDGLALELRKLVADLHDEGKGTIASDAYDLHGLRHTRGVELALAGCTDAQGAAMLGQASASSFAQYRRQAERIRLSKDGAEKVIELRRSAEKPEVETKVETECKPVARDDRSAG
jgi:hypothetical protein